MIALFLFLILCVLLFGAGAVKAGLGLVAVIAVALGLLGVVVFAVVWATPKIPGALGGFLRGYVRFLGAPVLGPVAYWRTVDERRARGERVGVISVGLTLLWTFIVGVFVAAMAWGILIGIANAVYEASLR
jgi:hypothetical protein